MKFYEIEIDGATVGCETSLKAAKALGDASGGPYTIITVEAPVNAETVRRLLGKIGGYGEVLGYREVA
jgi:hypothetical protein